MPSSEIGFNLEQKQNVQIDLFNLAGQLIYSTQLGAIEEAQIELPYVNKLATGYYIIQVSGTTVDYTDKLLILP